MFDDLLNKLLVKDPNKRISWDDYFIHPINILQRIEIYINIDSDNKETKIIDNEYFNYKQLKDSIMIIDNKINCFNCNFRFEKGKHMIIILYNNNLINCSGMFYNIKDIIEIKFINCNINKVKNIRGMFNNC